MMSYVNYILVEKLRGFLGGAVAKNMPANAGDAREWVWSLVREDPFGVGSDNPLQYSCLENSMDKGAWRVTVYGVAKSRTWLSD